MVQYFLAPQCPLPSYADSPAGVWRAGQGPAYWGSPTGANNHLASSGQGREEWLWVHPLAWAEVSLSQT